MFKARWQLGIVIHKVPESIAYDVILRAALRSPGMAMLWALIAQAATLLGAGLAFVMAPRIGSAWIAVLLALGGGTSSISDSTPCMASGNAAWWRAQSADFLVFAA